MIEIPIELLGNLPTVAIAAISAGMLRSVAGWLENSMRDEVIDEFELKKLYETVIKYFAYISLIMIGLPIEQAVTGAFIIDVGTSSLKSKSVSTLPNSNK